MIGQPVDFNNRKTLYSFKPLNSPEAGLARDLVKTSNLEDEVVNTVVSDLTALPANWLQRFKEEHIGIVVLKQDQTLADVPLWPEFSVEDADEMVPQCRPVIQEALQTLLGPASSETDPQARAYYLKMAAPEIKEELEKISNEKVLGFAVQPQSQATDWATLANSNGIDPEGSRFDHWRGCVEKLNEGLCSFSGEGVNPDTGFVLIPYVGYRGKHFRALTLPSLQSFGGKDLRLHDGANFPENHFLVMSDQAAPDPSVVSGHHRVVIHESGHMIDWLSRELPQLPGHEEKVKQLYQESMQANKTAAAGTGPILSDRAKDSPGEFFADSVEAYLTMPNENDFHKGDNNRLALQKRNPAMFDYLTKVLST